MKTIFRMIDCNTRLPKEESFYVVKQHGWAHMRVLRYFPKYNRWENNEEGILEWMESVEIPSEGIINKHITKLGNTFVDDDSFDFGMRCAKWMRDFVLAAPAKDNVA